MLIDKSIYIHYIHMYIHLYSSIIHISIQIHIDEKLVLGIGIECK